jgi:3-oxoadipate enol-lactonase
MSGQEGPACTVDQSIVLHRMIDGSEMFVIEKAAHLSNIERPDAFNGAVRAFIDRVDDRLPKIK